MNGITNALPAVSRDMYGTAVPEYEKNHGEQLFFMTREELAEYLSLIHI